MKTVHFKFIAEYSRDKQGKRIGLFKQWFLLQKIKDQTLRTFGIATWYKAIGGHAGPPFPRYEKCLILEIGSTTNFDKRCHYKRAFYFAEYLLKTLDQESVYVILPNGDGLTYKG